MSFKFSEYLPLITISLENVYRVIKKESCFEVVVIVYQSLQCVVTLLLSFFMFIGLHKTFRCLFYCLNTMSSVFRNQADKFKLIKGSSVRYRMADP